VRAPIRSIPDSIARWAGYARWLRSLDAVAAWLALWALSAMMLARPPLDSHAVVAALVLVGLAFIAPLRLWWRPVTACVALAVSRELRPGDRAWYVSPGHAELVLVTARRGLRVVIVTPARGRSEGVSVQRTRVLLVPEDDPRR
jgi:cell division protein FtsW (lipid II flippase)